MPTPSCTVGFAHSVETWRDGRLVGGLYGVAICGLFAGESMFSRETDASKVALVHLVERLRRGGYALLDSQFIAGSTYASVRHDRDPARRVQAPAARGIGGGDDVLSVNKEQRTKNKEQRGRRLFSVLCSLFFVLEPCQALKCAPSCTYPLDIPPRICYN